MVSVPFELMVVVGLIGLAHDSRDRRRCVQSAKEVGIAPDSEAVERYSR